MAVRIPIDNQPVASTFFGEGKWLTDFVSPNNPDVQKLHQLLTKNETAVSEKIIRCWDWVANQVKYVPFVHAELNVQGKHSVQKDYWQAPSTTINTRVGNCANKAFLLASLVRNELSDELVRVVLGNLHQAKQEGGHAWCEVDLDGDTYIMEATRSDMQPLVSARVANIYEDVIAFNDKTVSAVPDRALLVPFAAVYADWLKDYLDWAFIEGGK